MKSRVHVCKHRKSSAPVERCKDVAGSRAPETKDTLRGSIDCPHINPDKVLAFTIPIGAARDTLIAQKALQQHHGTHLPAFSPSSSSRAPPTPTYRRIS